MSYAGQRQGMGCFAKGCIVLVVLGVMFVGLLGFGAWFALQKIKPFTAETGVTMPVEPSTPEEYAALRQRIDAFVKSPAGKPASLALSAHHLNTLIAQSPEWNAAKGHIFFRVLTDQIAVLGSMPLSFCPGLQGRYLNGGIYFQPAVQQGAFMARVQQITIKAQPVSPAQQKSFEPVIVGGLNGAAKGDHVLGPVIAASDSLTFSNGNLVFTKK